MRSVLTKLIIVLIIIAAWVTYDNWDRIRSLSPTSVKDAVVHSMPALPFDTKKSTVYQWKDEKGKIHVSNTPPENAKNVKIIEYENDLNVVVPSTPPQRTQKERKQRKRIEKLNSVPGNNTTSNNQTGSQNNLDGRNVFSHYKTAIDDAKQVQEIMDQRNKNLQERLQ